MSPPKNLNNRAQSQSGVLRFPGFGCWRRRDFGENITNRDLEALNLSEGRRLKLWSNAIVRVP